MSYTPHGQHLINGDWVADAEKFQSNPAHGSALSISAGSVECVNAAVTAAESAFERYGYTRREARARLLQTIAHELENRQADIVSIAGQETALPDARLQGELARTCNQLRLFAATIEKGDYLDKRHQAALPDRAPIPGPDLKLVQRPIGPVAVFGASNFPLAFSVAGGDTAAALAAGCTVVVKAHPAHPGTSEVAADAIRSAIQSCDMPGGTFSMIHGESQAVGSALVTHPLIKAVGFTGSLAGGRALFNLCAARDEPIPFFGELGSINPVFLLPHAQQTRGADIGAAWAASLTMGVGQFCTNPGLLIGLSDTLEPFINSAIATLSSVETQTMLTEGIANAYARGTQSQASVAGVEVLLAGTTETRKASPALHKTSAQVWLQSPQLGEEVFGPLGLIVEVQSEEEMLAVARQLEGQLTCTLQMDESDYPLAGRLIHVLERKAGRVLANGFPTGVEVSDAMVHGGPYPASTNFGATSVGTMAIRRFLRPVCYQDIPVQLVSDWDE